MSRFLNKRYVDFEAYEAGEQPKGREYLKLNTNENPFPPSPKVAEALKAYDADGLRFYADPLCTDLRKKIADKFGLEADNVMPTNGSDDVLNYVIMAFGEIGKSQDDEPSFIFPDITYSFYSVLCWLHGVSYRTVPLEGDMTIDPEKFMDAGANVIIANPNAPTGIALPVADIEKIIKSNKDHVVMIDEAYVDFGWESCVPLIEKYDNLIVCHTFSKSRSFAGGRLGYALAQKPLIKDLEKIRQSQSPYNVDGIVQKLGEAALDDDAYYKKNCEEIKVNRRYLKNALLEMGFRVLPSSTNFLFAKHPDIKGTDMYEELKERGILVRHFAGDRIQGYNRIAIGTKPEMDRLIKEISEIIKEHEKDSGEE